MRPMMVRAVIDLPQPDLRPRAHEGARADLEGHVVDDVDVAVALELCTGR